MALSLGVANMTSAASAQVDGSLVFLAEEVDVNEPENAEESNQQMFVESSSDFVSPVIVSLFGTWMIGIMIFTLSIDLKNKLDVDGSCIDDCWEAV